MGFTIVMFFALIALYVAMVGLVKFSENVIATPQLVPSNDDTEREPIENARSL